MVGYAQYGNQKIRIKIKIYGLYKMHGSMINQNEKFWLIDLDVFITKIYSLAQHSINFCFTDL